MFYIDIIAIGKLKNENFVNICYDYCRRLKSIWKVCLIDLTKSKFKNKDDIINQESDRILKKIDFKSFVIALCVEGETVSSENLAKKIGMLQNRGYNKLSFLIGGAFGLNDKIKSIANFKLSLSKMTLTHQLTKIVLLEQLYRSYSILNNEPYHK